jgi:hypothetical protein
MNTKKKRKKPQKRSSSMLELEEKENQAELNSTKGK